MVFSSTVFLFLFLPLTLGLNAVLPKSYRNGLLLLLSLVFYAWGGVSLSLLMIGSILANYGFGRWIGAKQGKPAAKTALILGLVVNLGLLATFKYTNFLVENLNMVREWSNWEPMPWKDIILPIGISFFTFQAISYLMDVYRAEVPAQRNLFKLALYISLFPQLIAGPIVRYHDVETQLSDRNESLQLFASGVQRFILGLARKVLFANSFARIADEVFGAAPEGLSMSLAWIGLIAYALQIYHDFAGYSDMAIGLGRMLGFRFLENFDFPYLARSVREFWRRWHISLSGWFRDYLYIPLGGSRAGEGRTYFNLLVVFFLTGFWHGASWNFLIWGLWHGLFMVLERLGMDKWLSGKGSLLSRPYTLFVVLIAWVFFRADDLGHSWSYLKALFGLHGNGFDLRDFGVFAGPENLLILVFGVLGATQFFPWLKAQWVGQSEVRLRWLNGLALFGLSLMLFLSLVYVSASTYNPFIYFRF